MKAFSRYALALTGALSVAGCGTLTPGWPAPNESSFDPSGPSVYDYGSAYALPSSTDPYLNELREQTRIMQRDEVRRERAEAEYQQRESLRRDEQADRRREERQRRETLAAAEKLEAQNERIAAKVEAAAHCRAEHRKRVDESNQAWSAYYRGGSKGTPPTRPPYLSNC